jgi:hypothetical protein
VEVYTIESHIWEGIIPFNDIKEHFHQKTNVIWIDGCRQKDMEPTKHLLIFNSRMTIIKSSSFIQPEVITAWF